MGAPATGVAAGAALLAWGLVRRGPLAVLESDHELHAHLARARRRDEPTCLLIIRLSGDATAAARRLKESLRVTDSVCVIADGRAVELCAMLDRVQLDRSALEQRLRSLITEPVEIGWSGFPEDGLTLPVLVRAARQACEPVTAPNRHAVPDVSALPQGVGGT